MFDDRPIPVIFDEADHIYQRNEIFPDYLRHLKSVGLIDYSPGLSYSPIKKTSRLKAIYSPEILQLKPRFKNGIHQIGTENAAFTMSGEELLYIFDDIKPVDGFFEYCKEKWKSYLIDES